MAFLVTVDMVVPEENSVRPVGKCLLYGRKGRLALFSPGRLVHEEERPTYVGVLCQDLLEVS